MSDFGNPWHSGTPAEAYRKWFPVFYQFSAFDIVGTLTQTVALSKYATKSLKTKVTAAAIADGLRISLNYAEKRYVADEDIDLPRDPGLSHTIDTIFELGQSSFEKYFELFQALPRASNDLEDLSSQFFYRGIGGFEASKTLSELGYLCEVAVILRSLLEQIAFVAKLRTMNPDTDIAKVRPLQCLGYFKSIDPFSGRLYGLLSKYTHFEFDHHTHFFSRSKEAVFTVQRDSVLRAYATHLLFISMLSTAKYITLVAPQQFINTPKPIHDLQRFKEDVLAYSNKVRSLFPADSILVQFDEVLRSGYGMD